MIYKIRPERINTYGMRKALGFALPFLISILILVSLLVLAVDKRVALISDLFGKVHWLLLIVGYIYGTLWYQNRNLAKSTSFEITSDFVGRFLEKDKLNVGNQYGIRKNERRYGVKMNQIIPNKSIAKISISNSKIRIRSGDYNFFNGNGQIEIPKEIEAFDKLKDHFLKLKKELNIV